MAIGNISGELTPETIEIIKQKVEGIKTDMPFLVNLTKDQRKRLQTIGPNRLGYVTEVNLASNAHKMALAADFNLDEYNKDKNLLAGMAEVFSWISPLHDSLVSTMMALGSEVLKESGQAYGYLKTSAKSNNNQSLNSAIERIAVYFKRAKKDDKAE